MNLVFEGCDKAGKSSIIQGFREHQFFLHHLNWPVVKYSGPKIAKTIRDKWRGEPAALGPIQQAEMMSEYFSFFRIIKATGLDRVICDRLFLGEFVYCMLRGYRYPDAEEDYWLDIFSKFMVETNSALVYVSAPSDVIISRMRKAGGDVFTPEAAVPVILDAYNELLPRVKCPVIRISTAGLSEEQGIALFEKKLDVLLKG